MSIMSDSRVDGVRQSYMAEDQEENWRFFDAGMVRKATCSPAQMRETLRNLWEESRDTGKTPYLAVHDSETNTIYEGCKIDGWATCDGEETASFTQMELPRRNIKVANVVMLMILA